MSTIAPATSAASASNNNLTLNDFLKVLLTQLTYQDPLKPMDNQQFMAQMAQFTNLQQTQELNTNIQRLLTNQAAFQSVGLIGHTVDLTTSSGPQTGRVTALSLTNAAPLLSVQLSDGTTLSNVDLSQVSTVR